MTKLRTLRSQLASLRSSRQFMRLGTGYAALLIALLWILLAIFVLDYGFQLVEFQRAIVIAIGIGALVWAAMKFTAPFLGQHETDIDMALLVERQHGIDSDLVAALQFESEEAGEWGSPELEGAVVDYVAQLDRGLDVYEGISHEQFWKRLGILVATLAVVVGLVAYGPGYAHVFLLRLALDDIHYPSDTLIERVVVNGDESLLRSEHGTSPMDAQAVQGRSVVFAAWVDGDVPAQGNVTISPRGGGARDLQLTKVDRGQLLSTIQLLQSHVRPEEKSSAPELGKLSPDARADTAKVIANATGFDIVRVEQSLQNADRYDPVLAESWQQLKQLSNAWDADVENAADEDQATPATQLFVGKLPRLLDPADYSIQLGDAWTDRASIAMTALPVVQPRFTETPPEYARQNKDDQVDPGSLQRSVMEGSRLELAIRSSKPLQEATFTVVSSESGESLRDNITLMKVNSAAASRIWPDEERADSSNEIWRLDPAETSLADIRGPFRYEIQVIDEDGLSLETPLRGAIRLRADRPPRISGTLVHRVVLPTASPEVELRVDDDYGIAAIKVNITVLQGEDNLDQPREQTEATFDVTELLPLRGNMSPSVADQRKGAALQFPLQGDQLPRLGTYRLELSSLNLQRGDEVRIVLVAVDYRGETEGASAESEPIILEITDESGILAAVSEGDRRSQEQIDDLIRRQLGIGEAP